MVSLLRTSKALRVAPEPTTTETLAVRPRTVERCETAADMKGCPSVSQELDVEANLIEYVGNRQSTSRYASFDYCFNHFQSHSQAGRLDDLTHGAPLQLSCLHLGFYLASWGMLRGSSELLKRSARSFVPVIEALVAAPRELWTLDVDGYSEETIAAILSFATTLRRTLHGGASDILVTKILLGTMGSVPAFDTNFRIGFDGATFCRKSLRRVHEFYNEHAEVVDAHRERTLDFDTGVPTERRYTRAKVIDMIFFIEGIRKISDA